MSRRAGIGDYPRFGYALETKGAIVGVILLIFSRRGGEAGGGVRCNISSWCVDEEYRGHALSLHLMAVRHKEVTYLNISPAMHTRSTIEALGFRRFSNGQMFFAPILSRPQPGVRVCAFSTDGPEARLLSPGERQLLADHVAMGCRALVCVKDGAAYPFVFQDRMVFRRLVPCPQLIYCRRIEEFSRFANSIGRYLLPRTGPFSVVDATGPIEGLAGRYFPERSPKYFKGPAPPSLGDLSYTELVVLGP